MDIANKMPSGFDPVTQADRQAEQAIRDVLRTHRPEDGILGEEYSAHEGISPFVWVIDPIDGTRGYVAGTPVWGTLIAVAQKNSGYMRPLAGLIDQPYIGERFWGGFGEAHLRTANKQIPLRTSTRTLDNAVLCTTFPEVGTEHERQGFEAVSRRAKLTRYGFDCYAYALLAAGHVDLVIEAGLHPYDIQAPTAVIEAAGGVVTNWSGQATLESGQVLAAANRKLHDEVLAILRAYAGK